MRATPLVTAGVLIAPAVVRAEPAAYPTALVERMTWLPVRAVDDLGQVDLLGEVASLPNDVDTDVVVTAAAAARF